MKEKRWTTLTGLCIGCLTITANAATNTYQSSGSTQSEPAGKMGDYHAGRTREITPNAGPRVSDGADVFITADFIYWTGREDGLGFAYTGARSSNLDPKKGEIKHPDFGFDPGFKVGLGLNLGHDGWDVFAEYTWLHSDGDKRTVSASDPSNSSIRPLWLIDPASMGPSTPISRASGEWDLHFNVIDLELGRNFFVSRYLTLRPHFGFKGTWQDEDYTVRYEEPESGEVFISKMRIDQDFWGVGLRTGLDTAWHFTRRWSIFGDVALTALWCYFDVDRKDTTDFMSIKDTVLNTENDFHSIKGVIEIALGLRWEIWFRDDDYHFLIQAGWEEQIWLNRNQYFRHAEEGSHGDLTFQGLTLKLRFDF